MSEVKDDVKGIKLLQPFHADLLKEQLRPNSKAYSQGRDKYFRKKLLDAYKDQPDKQDKLLCMGLGVRLNKEGLRAGHLFPVRLQVQLVVGSFYHLPLKPAALQSRAGLDGCLTNMLCLQRFRKKMGLADINDVRNGVVWCDALEAAWEAWALAIGCDGQEYYLEVFIPSSFSVQRPLCDDASRLSSMLLLRVVTTVLQVVDKTWENIKLSEKSTTQRDPSYVAELQRWTYGDLQGRKLSFPPTLERPCKRSVLLMGQLMVDWAKERNSLSEGVELAHFDADKMTDCGEKEAVIKWLETSVNLPALRRELEEGSDEEV